VPAALYNYYFGSVTSRFNHPDCVHAYYNMLCYMNFPRCDGTGQSMGMCRSVCENFFK